MDYFVRFVSVALVVAGNEVVADVASFQLTCWDGKTGDHCEGQLDIPGEMAARLTNSPQALMLELPDGRTLPFEVTDLTGRIRITTGRCT